MRSELYFHEYMKYIKEAIVNFNREYGFEEDQKLEIKSMTGSNYHSLIMFLHASDLHETVIEEEVWKLKSLIILHDQASDIFDEYDWAKTNKTKMRELQEMVWKNRVDIFDELGKDLNRDELDPNLVMKGVHQHLPYNKYKMDSSVDDINEALEDSLNYIVESINEVEEENQRGGEKMRELARRLSISLKEAEDYEAINLENSRKTVTFFKFFISKFRDIVKFVIYRLPSIPDKIIQYLSLEQRAEAWKGIIIGETLKAFQIKNYVSEKLLQLGLRNNTTLK